jgi:hypothetical protein
VGSTYEICGPVGQKDVVCQIADCLTNGAPWRGVGATAEVRRRVTWRKLRQIIDERAEVMPFWVRRHF